MKKIQSKKFNFEKKDFVKKLVFNCNYPAVREHVNHLFLSLHQVSTERNAIPIWLKTKFLQPRSQKVSYRCALGWNDMKSTRRVLGHSLVRSLVRSHHSLNRLHRTARFARVLRCAHSFARWLAHSLAPGLMGMRFLATTVVEPTVERSSMLR